MSESNLSTAAEFRPYRQFLTVLVLTLIVVGAAYLFASVSVALYRQRHTPAVAVSNGMTSPDRHECFSSLSDVTEELAKHLENSHRLLAATEPEEVQTWTAEGAVWRRGWQDLGRRCGFPGRPMTEPDKEHAQMAAVHMELGAIQDAYVTEIKRFGRLQVPRLHQVRERMQRIATRLDRERGHQGVDRP